MKEASNGNYICTVQMPLKDRLTVKDKNVLIFIFSGKLIALNRHLSCVAPTLSAKSAETMGRKCLVQGHKMLTRLRIEQALQV